MGRHLATYLFLVSLMCLIFGWSCMAQGTRSSVGSAAPGSPALPPAMAPKDLTPLRLTGHLTRYLAGTHEIVVATDERVVRLSLTSLTRVHRGRDRLDQSSLVSEIGSAIVVRYTENATSRVALSVNVLDGARK